MEIPKCYDPVFQEERRQARMDRRAAHLPRCGCCGRPVCPGEAFYELAVRREALTVCQDCRREMERNVCFVEAVEF